MRGFLVAVMVLCCVLQQPNGCTGRSLQNVQNTRTRSILQYNYTESDTCSAFAEAAASVAATAACHKLKILCSVGTDAQDDHVVPNPYENIKLECLREAKIGCRAKARILVTKKGDPVCTDLLMKGPDRPLTGCWNWQEAVDEFNWAVKEVCERKEMYTRSNSSNSSGR